MKTEANIFVDEEGKLSKWGAMESMRVRVLGFQFLWYKILRIGGSLKKNPERKRSCSYAADYNRCISQFYAALF